MITYHLRYGAYTVFGIVKWSQPVWLNTKQLSTLLRDAPTKLPGRMLKTPIAYKNFGGDSMKWGNMKSFRDSSVVMRHTHHTGKEPQIQTPYQNSLLKSLQNAERAGWLRQNLPTSGVKVQFRGETFQKNICICFDEKFLNKNLQLPALTIFWVPPHLSVNCVQVVSSQITVTRVKSQSSPKKTLFKGSTLFKVVPRGRLEMFSLTLISVGVYFS